MFILSLLTGSESDRMMERVIGREKMQPQLEWELPDRAYNARPRGALKREFSQ